jgi:hypothetical protein
MLTSAITWGDLLLAEKGSPFLGKNMDKSGTELGMFYDGPRSLVGFGGTGVNTAPALGPFSASPSEPGPELCMSQVMTNPLHRTSQGGLADTTHCGVFSVCCRPEASAPRHPPLLAVAGH